DGFEKGEPLLMAMARRQSRDQLALEIVDRACGASAGSWRADRHRITRCRAPSTCRVGSAGCRRLQCALGFISSLSYRFWSRFGMVWLLEALSSAAVT